MRLKANKQDPRMERPQARGNEDGIIVGDLDDPASPFSIFLWIQRLFAFHGAARPENSPFFLDRDRTRHLTYANAMKYVRRLLARVVGTQQADTYGLHVGGGMVILISSCQKFSSSPDMSNKS